MNTKNKIIFVAAVVGVIAVLLIILSRNSPRYAETQVLTPMPDTSFSFNAPSKTNVSSSFTDRVEQLKKSTNENPSNAAHLIALAQLLMDGHQNTEAIIYFEKAVALQPKNDSLLLDLSVCYFNEKEYGKALKTTEKILSRQRYHTRALYNKGAILATLDRKNEAVTVWKELMKHNPNSEEAKTVQGHISLLEKK